MLNDFFHSIAGKSRNEKVDSLVHDVLSIPNLTRKDLRSVNYVKEVAESGGRYPSKEYFIKNGYEVVNPSSSIAEITLLVKRMKDFYHKEFIAAAAFSAVNESSSASDLISKLRQVAVEDLDPDSIDLSTYSARLDSTEELKPSPNAFKLGVSDIDSITGGFQPGTLASICAFTAQGKSSMLVSSCYKNIKAGLKGVMFSLEVTPQIVKLQLFCRYLYEEHSFSVSPKDIMEGSLSDSDKEKMNLLVEDFNEFIDKKLLIVDESFLNAKLLTDYHLLNKLYSNFEDFLEGLDFITYDHINQIDLMFKDLGRTAVKTITSAGKTYVSKSSGICPVTILCVQTNREGYKRAVKKSGKYDLIAIADNSEVERSSHYVVFMYTSDDMKLLQETKMCMLKHRYGALLTEPVTVNFNAANFFVGEEVEVSSYEGDFSFLSDSSQNSDLGINIEEFDDF